MWYSVKMNNLKKLMVVTVLALLLIAPRAEAIIYFGGATGIIIPCVNNVIYAVLGPPRGGPYLWSPEVTQTYSFGPPTRSGQWLLGSAGPSIICLQSIFPFITHAGLLMLMMGSSQ